MDNNSGNSEIAIETLLELDDTEGLLIQLFMILEGKRPTHGEKIKFFRRALRAFARVSGAAAAMPIHTWSCCYPNSIWHEGFATIL